MPLWAAILCFFGGWAVLIVTFATVYHLSRESDRKTDSADTDDGKES